MSPFFKVRNWLEHNLVTTLVISFVFVMFVPEVKGFLPTEAVTILLASVVLFACSRIHRDELKQIRFLRAVHFYWTRFLVLPAIVYGLFYFVYPPFKEAALLLALIPSGTSCPGFTFMLKGNVSLGLGGVVIASMLTPFVLPSYFSLVGVHGVEVDTMGMLISLCIMVLLPIAIYFLFLVRFEPVKHVMRENATAYTVIILNVILILIISEQRDMILADPLRMAICVGACLCVFAVIFFYGWFYGYHSRPRNRISYSILSGVNNTALGMAVAVLFFPDVVVQFMVASEVAWLISLPCFMWFLKRYARSE